jgi:hypothetical protein
MQRKQEVGECWVCVILFAREVMYEHMHRGVRGGAIGTLSGGGSTNVGFQEQCPRKRKICIRTALYLGGFSTHGFFADGFYFW